MRTTSKARRRLRAPAAFMVAIAAAAAAAVAALAGVSAWAQAPAVAPAKQRYVQGSWVNLRDAAQSQARVVDGPDGAGAFRIVGPQGFVQEAAAVLGPLAQEVGPAPGCAIQSK